VNHGPDEIAYWLEVAEARALVDVGQATAGLDGDPLQARWDLDHDRATFWFGAVDIGIFNRCIGLGIGRPATEAVVDSRTPDLAFGRTVRDNHDIDARRVEPERGRTADWGNYALGTTLDQCWQAASAADRGSVACRV
jgi:hypothetical protein